MFSGKKMIPSPTRLYVHVHTCKSTVAHLSHAGTMLQFLIHSYSRQWPSPGRSPQLCRCVWCRPRWRSGWSRSERGRLRSPAWCSSLHCRPAQEKKAHIRGMCTHIFQCGFNSAGAVFRMFKMVWYRNPDHQMGHVLFITSDVAAAYVF